MPRRESNVNEETFNVFEDTNSSASSTSSSTSASQVEVVRRRIGGRSTGRAAGSHESDAGLVPALQHYFKHKGGLQFADSCVFVRIGEEDVTGPSLAATGERAVVLPPLPPPPREVIGLAATDPAGPSRATQTVAVGKERERSAGEGASLRIRPAVAAAALDEAPPQVKVVRRMEAERAARVAGLRPIRSASAGTASVDLLNTNALPVTVVPAREAQRGRRHQQRRDERRRRRQERAQQLRAQCDAGGAAGSPPETTPRPELGGPPGKDRRLTEPAASPPSPPPADASSASAAGASIGTGSHSGASAPTSHTPPDKAGVAAQQPSRRATASPHEGKAVRKASTDAGERAFVSTGSSFCMTHSGSSSTSTSTTAQEQEDDDASDEAFWRQQDLDRLSRRSPVVAVAQAGGVDPAAGTVPPLRAHVYIEENNGKFLDHETHAQLQARRAAQSARNAAREEHLRLRALRRARRRGLEGGSVLSGGDEGWGDGATRPRQRRGQPFPAGLDAAGHDDPRQFRLVTMLFLQYARRVSVFLSALACGAAVTLLIMATLPSVSLELDVADGGGDGKGGGRIAADSLAVLVLAVRLFDAPFFLFLTLMLTAMALLPLMWTCAEHHWRRQRQERRAMWHECLAEEEEEGRRDDRGGGGENAFSTRAAAARGVGLPVMPVKTVSATAMHRRIAFRRATLRHTVQALTAEAHQRQHGGADGGDFSSGVDEAKQHEHGVAASAATGALDEGYSLDPSVAMQLNPHAFRAEALKRQRGREARQEQQQQETDLFTGTTMRRGGRWRAASLSIGNEVGGDGGSGGGASMLLGSLFAPPHDNSTATHAFDASWGMSGSRLTRTASLPLPHVSPTRHPLDGRQGSFAASVRGARDASLPQRRLSRPVTPPHAAPASSSLAAFTDLTRGSTQQMPTGHGGRGGGHGAAAEARLRFADRFLLGGGMLAASNPAAIRMRAFQRWLVVSFLGGADTPRVELLIEPRLWCLVVCLAMSVVELALLDARTAAELLSLLSISRPAGLTDPVENSMLSQQIGYTQEGRLAFHLKGTSASEVDEGGILSGEPWTRGSVRAAFLAIYAVRATMLLCVWLLDVFL